MTVRPPSLPAASSPSWSPPGGRLHARRVGQQRQVLVVRPGDPEAQANAVKGGKNATEASWIQDWVIPNFQKQMADQGRQVTVQYVGTGADDEDVKTSWRWTCAPAARPTCSRRTGPGWGSSPRPGS
jgi:hypothetical protein